MIDRMAELMPELAADPDGFQTLLASNEANLVLVADLLEAAADPRKAELPTPTLAYTQVGAHHNTPLPGLMRVYRTGHAYVWEVLLGIMREQVSDPDELTESIRLVSAWLHEFIDESVCLAEEAYNSERERFLRSSAASGSQTVIAILDGQSVDPTVASQRLRYELGRQHVGFVAWFDPADSVDHPIEALEAALDEVVGRIGLGRPFTHALGLSSVAGWAGAHDEIPAEALAEAAGDPSVAGTARMAAGDPGVGLEGFRRTHAEAMDARRVAGLAAAPPGSLTLHHSVALVAMATADLDRARSFSKRNLGGLADDAGSDRLSETLRAYLDAGGSHGRAAQKLGIHENTVRYRVRQAEEILARPVGPQDLDLRVALSLADLDLEEDA